MDSPQGSTAGQRVRQAREAAGLTQEQLGLAVKAAQSTVARWEGSKREPTLAELRRIATVVGVPTSTLIPDCDCDQS